MKKKSKLHKLVPSEPTPGTGLTEFLEIFDFRYTANQWEEIERVIKTQPGEHDTKEIREALELEARKYRVVPRLETRTERGAANLADMKKVSRLCERLRDLLTGPAFSRDYALWTLLSQADRDAVIAKVADLQEKAKAVAANNEPLSQKNRQADPLRDRYLAGCAKRG